MVYNQVYVVVKGIIMGAINRDRKNRGFVLKNNAPFIFCISKVNSVLTENAEDLDVVITLYNFPEYSKNYSTMSGSLRNYYRDELTDEEANANGPNKNVANTKSFKYKTGITESIYNVYLTVIGDNGNSLCNPAYNACKSSKKEVQIAMPLKHLSSFWNILNITLINCEVHLTCSANCVITSLEKRILVVGQQQRDNSPTGATFQITDCRFEDLCQ